MSKFDMMLVSAASRAKQYSQIAEVDIDNIRCRQAHRMLDLFRELLAEHALHRHEIRLRTGMGTACIFINGRLFEDGWHMSDASTLVLPPRGVGKTLGWILAQLSHDWACFLDDILLNEPKGK